VKVDSERAALAPALKCNFKTEAPPQTVCQRFGFGLPRWAGGARFFLALIQPHQFLSLAHSEAFGDDFFECGDLRL